MYIKDITIENIRSFDKLHLDFSSGEDVHRQVLLLGDNGVGKTTILRCIALGLCDDTSASALLSENAVGDLRRHETDADPRITLTVVSAGQQPYKIITTISRSESGIDVNVRTDPDQFPWKKVFCCGYGIARRPFTYDAYSQYRVVDSVYTLFNYESGLWSPEVVLSRLSRSYAGYDDILRRLEDVLELEREALALGEKGLVIRGPWKGELALEALGDGYSATLGWLADMLGWALLHYGKNFDVTSLEGVVLVDMIERDLHPTWQKSILKRLQQHFPKIQFFTTTHAPMIALGTSEFTDNECELIALHWHDDHTEATENIRPPRNSRVDEILTSMLFGVSSVNGSEARNQVERFVTLLSKERGTHTLADSEAKELSHLREQLAERFRLQTFETQLLEFLSVATDEQVARKTSSMSDEELESSVNLVHRLRTLLNQ